MIEKSRFFKRHSNTLGVGVNIKKTVSVFFIFFTNLVNHSLIAIYERIQFYCKLNPSWFLCRSLFLTKPGRAFTLLSGESHDLRNLGYCHYSVDHINIMFLWLHGELTTSSIYYIKKITSVKALFMEKI